MKEQRNWFKIDEEVVGQSGKFFEQSERFAGHPKGLLRKTEEKIDRSG
jgi:hypothetical protein